MKTAEREWEEQDDPAERAAKAAPARNRRLLLGGMALAASGLVLPARLVGEAQADDQPVRRVQQRKEQKRRKSGHQRHDRHKRRPGAGKSRGSGVRYHDVAIYIYNYRYDPVRVEGWVRHTHTNQDPYYKPNKDWDWATMPAVNYSTGKPSTRAFIGDDDFVAVRIGTDIVVTAANHWVGFPEAAILSGGWDAKHGWNPEGETLNQGPKMWVNDSFAWNGIKVTRVEDTEDHKVFSVELT